MGRLIRQLSPLSFPASVLQPKRKGALPDASVLVTGGADHAIRSVSVEILVPIVEVKNTRVDSISWDVYMYTAICHCHNCDCMTS